jgi:hypothetical protein
MSKEKEPTVINLTQEDFEGYLDLQDNKCSNNSRTLEEFISCVPNSEDIFYKSSFDIEGMNIEDINFLLYSCIKKGVSKLINRDFDKDLNFISQEELDNYHNIDKKTPGLLGYLKTRKDNSPNYGKGGHFFKKMSLKNGQEETVKILNDVSVIPLKKYDINSKIYFNNGYLTVYILRKIEKIQKNRDK